MPWKTHCLDRGKNALLSDQVLTFTLSGCFYYLINALALSVLPSLFIAMIIFSSIPEALFRAWSLLRMYLPFLNADSLGCNMLFFQTLDQKFPVFLTYQYFRIFTVVGLIRSSLNNYEQYSGECQLLEKFGSY